MQWLDPGAFGTLGVGGGFALGAKLCRPESEVWIIWGDGSCGYSLAETDTMQRFGAPVIGLVGNDAGWTQILREQEPMFGSSVACKLLVRDFLCCCAFMFSQCLWFIYPQFITFSPHFSTLITMKWLKVMEEKVCF